MSPSCWPAAPTAAEYVVQQSRFMAQIIPLSNSDPAKNLDEAHRQYPHATHYAWAFRWENGLERAEDDGEPHGTAGLPLLGVLRSHAIEHAMLLVARYFGGIKLGRHGLWRAYRTAGETVVAAAVLKPVLRLVRLTLTVPYQFEPTLRAWIRNTPHRDIRLDYAEEVRWEGWIGTEDLHRLERLQELCAGTAGLYVQQEEPGIF